MQNRIAYHILSLLYLNGKVRIPGIGRIEQHHHKAVVDDDASTVAPPQTDSAFEEDRQKKNRLLERFVAYKANTSRTRARREIARFSNEIKSGLKKEGKVELKYLGTFSSMGDALLFSPEEDLLNPGHSVYKGVPLPTRLIGSEEPESVPYAAIDFAIPVTDAVEEASTFHQEEKLTEESGQPAPVESVANIPEYELITPSPVFEEEKKETVVIPAPVLPTIPASLTKPTVPSAPAAKKIATTQVKEKPQWPIAIPIAALILLGLLVGAFLFYQSRISHKEDVVLNDTTLTQDHTQQVPTTESITNEENAVEEKPEETQDETKIALADTGTRDESEIVSGIDETTPKETESKTETPTTPVESVHVATGDCLIVLGAFSMNSNIERMIHRLQAMGYTTVTNPRDQLTQVAVPVDCKAKDLQVVLDFLRKNVEQQAWVMRPK